MRFGIEEEFFVIDPATGRPAALDTADREAMLQATGGGSATVPEWLQCQVESATPICSTGPEALASLTGYRRALGEAVARLGLSAAALATPPDVPSGEAPISPGSRYREIHDLVPGLAAEQYISGLHVHLEIPHRDAGVRILNYLRQWLPTLTALAANSPLWRGRDTGFASWRTIRYRQWLLQGLPPHFHDGRDYDARLGRLLALPEMLDANLIGWSARLSERYPTVEVRALDTQLRADESVLFALILRALAAEALHGPPVPDDIAPELADIAPWHASRYGLTGSLISLPSGAVVPAEAVVHTLLETIRPHLEASGDAEDVARGLTHLLAAGNGAQRQRGLFATGGTAAVAEHAARELTAARPATTAASGTAPHP
ncbi:YbdK family carboxylate-amine ligase [Arthrobacter sp. JSM 101049]|uniref:carboxylate-amine ligase n=1 Tax=Arthrobacter sp. JSM 101049 TaxID=929097 RepID=UPI00356792DF